MKLEVEKMDYKALMRTQGNDESIQVEQHHEEKIVEYDYKIVAFKIGKEFYGIDIMCVKEIFKENKFTRVPNTLNFVKGVYNLRGEIIPIIDLAKMFNLRIDSAGEKELKPIIVIRVENLLIGLIVEQIQRVISLKQNDIQPPSPLLGAINEKFIHGVAEIDSKLYVIFDTDEIFSAKEKAKKDVLPKDSDLSEEFFVHFCSQIEELSNVHINSFNKMKFQELFIEYIEANQITGMPEINKQNSDNFINRFYSRYTYTLWDQPYVDNLITLVRLELSKICSEEVRVLVVGCANGSEAFSLYFMLDKFLEVDKVTLVAADNNLQAIASASGFEVSKEDIPAWIERPKYFMEISNGLYKIKKEINNSIYFEFHDIRNIGSYAKEFDMIVARDLSLEISEQDYKTFLSDALKKLVKGGVLVIGDNEDIIKMNEFERIRDKNITIFKKN